MNIIELIQQLYGDSCQLRSPLNKRQLDKARKLIPAELLEILKISNGIYKTMINPDTNQTEVIDLIVYSLADIKSQTEHYRCEYGGEGFVFSGDLSVGFFVLKPDGKIFRYDYYNLNEEYYAENLEDWLRKCKGHL